MHNPFAKQVTKARRLSKNWAVLLGYARVSKAEGQDASLQMTALRAAGCGRVFQERDSGGRWDRPEWDRLLDQPRSGDGMIVGISRPTYRDRRGICCSSWSAVVPFL